MNTPDSVSSNRTYKKFTYKEAVFNICCSEFDAVTEEIKRQRHILEDYIEIHPEFKHSLVPLELKPGAPDSAKRMARAAQLVGVGPMAAVAGTMAQLGAEAGLKAGAKEAIVENGGDIFLFTTESVMIGLYTGTDQISDRLGFLLKPNDTPISICSSSGKMGHSMSKGLCDLATVVSRDAALADAAATQAANMVKSVDDIDAALNKISIIEGVDGVLIVKDDKIGLAGRLPQLVKSH